MAQFVILRVGATTDWTDGVLSCLATKLGDEGYISPEPSQANGRFQRYEIHLGDPPPADAARVVRSLLDQCDSDWPGTMVVAAT